MLKISHICFHTYHTLQALLTTPLLSHSLRTLPPHPPHIPFNYPNAWQLHPLQFIHANALSVSFSQIFIIFQPFIIVEFRCLIFPIFGVVRYYCLCLSKFVSNKTSICTCNRYWCNAINGHTQNTYPKYCFIRATFFSLLHRICSCSCEVLTLTFLCFIDVNALH